MSSARKPRGFTPTEDPEAMMLSDLERSGLTARDADALGFEPVAAARSVSETFYNVPAYRIPYFDLDGAPLRSRPGEEPFYRLRYLREPAPAPKEFRKYTQPAGTTVAPYLPRIGEEDWRAIAADPEHPLVFTEGEKKAVKATREGFPTIGLGGVDSFASRRTGFTFHPILLKEFVWLRRFVVIIYDSDAATKPGVCAAANRLAEELAHLGALPHYLYLEDVPGLDKAGLDDWIAHYSPAEFRRVLTSNPEPITAVEALFSLNDCYAYVRDIHRVVEIATGNTMSADDFKNLQTARVYDRVVTPKGITHELVPVGAPWIRWGLRRDAARIVYDPAAPPRALTADGYNAWPGWAVEPVRDDALAAPFVKLIDHLFTGAPESEKKWFTQWIAYQFQHPGVKLYTSVILVSITSHGVGKSLIGYTLKAIFGSNFSEITQSDFHESFNDYAEFKQFVLGDDVGGTGSAKRVDLELLKKRVTQHEITINKKNQPKFKIRDCINYLWTSNQPNAFPVESVDRRFFVHEITVPPLPMAFYNRYDELYRSGPRARDFAAAVFAWLLAYDTSDFNPRAAPPKTDAKAEMTRATQSPIANWVDDLLVDPDGMLRDGDFVHPQDLFTIRTLTNIYASYAGVVDRSRVPTNAVANELKRKGVKRVLNGMPVRVGGEGQDRYYILRNDKYWLKADRSADDVRKHLEVKTTEIRRK